MPERPIALNGSAYDRVAEHRSDDAWLDAAWSRADTRVLVVAGSRAFAPDAVLTWQAPGDVADQTGLRVLLGENEAGVVSFALVVDQERADDSYAGLRAVVAALDPADAGYVVHAVGLAEWHLAVRRCPRCGGHLTPIQSGHVLRCDDCGRDQFPRSDPAVIMLVVDDQERAVLGRQRVWPERRWSTLAGFVEPGESLEAAVRREVFEEVGIRVGDVDYFGSQPWPLPASLMVGFVAHATTHEITVDGDEIEEARWFTREEAFGGAEQGLVQMPSGISISRALIEHWYGEALPGQWA